MSETFFGGRTVTSTNPAHSVYSSAPWWCCHTHSNRKSYFPLNIRNSRAKKASQCIMNFLLNILTNQNSYSRKDQSWETTLNHPAGANMMSIHWAESQKIPERNNNLCILSYYWVSNIYLELQLSCGYNGMGCRENTKSWITVCRHQTSWTPLGKHLNVSSFD